MAVLGEMAMGYFPGADASSASVGQAPSASPSAPNSARTGSMGSASSPSGSSLGSARVTPSRDPNPVRTGAPSGEGEGDAAPSAQATPSPFETSTSQTGTPSPSPQEEVGGWSVGGGALTLVLGLVVLQVLLAGALAWWVKLQRAQGQKEMKLAVGQLSTNKLYSTPAAPTPVFNTSELLEAIASIEGRLGGLAASEDLKRGLASAVSLQQEASETQLGKLRELSEVVARLGDGLRESQERQAHGLRQQLLLLMMLQGSEAERALRYSVALDKVLKASEALLGEGQTFALLGQRRAHWGQMAQQAWAPVLEALAWPDHSVPWDQLLSQLDRLKSLEAPREALMDGTEREALCTLAKQWDNSALREPHKLGEGGTEAFNRLIEPLIQAQALASIYPLPGAAFDAAWHQPQSWQPSQALPVGTIHHCLRRGFRRLNEQAVALELAEVVVVS